MKYLKFFEEIHVYHGTPKEFTKFDYDKIRGLIGSDTYGYGFYFTSSSDVAKAYNDAGKTWYVQHVTLHKGKTPDQYDYLIFDEKLTDKQKTKIKRGLKSHNIEVEIDNMNGWDIMSFLAKYFHNKYSIADQFKLGYHGAKKEASMFLLECGIDGLKYPFPSHIMSYEEGYDGYNYVVFSPDSITVDNIEKVNETFEDGDVDKAILKDIFSRANKEEWVRWKESNNVEGDDLWEFNYFLRDEKGMFVDNGVIEFYKLWEDVEELIGNNPVKLYHFTSKKFEKSIRENGLQTGHNRTNAHANSYSGIYLTTETTGNTIDGYKRHIRKYKADIIIVTVKMYMNELEPDPDDADISSGETQYVTGNISPERIIDIEETY